MRILQVSFADINGGAEKVAHDLHHAYQELGHHSVLVVGHQRLPEQEGVIGLVPERFSLAWFRYRLTSEFERRSGIQAAGYWMFGKWWCQNRQKWDVVHLHNLHSGYFDLRILLKIGAVAPVVQTLHDCWQMTGHCASPIAVSQEGCSRWQQGCGQCPDLAAYPAVRRDQTSFNWQRKQRIYAQTRPTIVTPSRWLQSLVGMSLLKDLRCKVIFNGVDTEQYREGDQRQARARLDLPARANLLLYVANGGLRPSPNRDPELAIDTLQQLAKTTNHSDVVLVSVGGEASLSNDLADRVIQRPFQREDLADYYRAADVYLHATKADNLPMTILEAMACGLPVVANDVGGCRELVAEGQTGYVVARGDSTAFTAAVSRLLDLTHRDMGRAAAQRVRSEFSLAKMTEGYLELYQTLAAGGR